jgi:hypothetical protein
MCDLANGTIEYRSRIQRQEAERILASLGAKSDLFGDYLLPIDLTDQQKDYLKDRLPKHYSSVKGKIRILMTDSAVVVDGDIMAYDTKCGMVDVRPHPFCEEGQTPEQKQKLYDVAERIRELIET